MGKKLRLDDGSKVTRARVDRATACHYDSSQRIVLIADGGDYVAALDALVKLADSALGVGSEELSWFYGVLDTYGSR